MRGRRHLSIYKVGILAFVIIYAALSLFTLYISKARFREIATDLITSKLESDINYIYDTLGDGYWHIEEDGFYKGDTFIGDATEENANLEPFYYIEDKTKTFSYVFQKCSDEGLAWTGDNETGYQQGHFIRIAGSTKNPKGESIVGTYMDKKVADVIDVNKEYIGEANVAGGMIHCIYRALCDEQGNIVGCIVVGRHISELNSLIDQYAVNLAFLIIIATLAGGVMLLSIFRSLFKNIDRITEYITNLEHCQGELSVKTVMLAPIVDSVNALKEAQLEVERKRCLAETDTMTGLKNRFGMDNWLSENYAAIQEGEKKICINLIDVDYFKEFNDNYGHPVGDECLKLVAGVLVDACKKYGGNPYRLGGDEFIIIYADCRRADIEGLQKYIHEDLASKNMRHEYSEVSNRVSVSQGAYITVPDAYVTFYDVYVAADRVLYKTKENGKNGYTLEVGSL